MTQNRENLISFFESLDTEVEEEGDVSFFPEPTKYFLIRIDIPDDALWSDVREFASLNGMAVEAFRTKKSGVFRLLSGETIPEIYCTILNPLTESIEEEEDETESEYDIDDLPVPGYEMIKKVYAQMSEDYNLPSYFTDCSSYPDKFPTNIDDFDLTVSPSPNRYSQNLNARIFNIPLRDVPPLLDLAYENLTLRICYIPGYINRQSDNPEDVYEASLWYMPIVYGGGYNKNNPYQLLKPLVLYKEVNGELQEIKLPSESTPLIL